jgi:beta-glucanase (GH16 family)
MEETTQNYFPNTSRKHRFTSSLLTSEYEKPWLNDPVFRKTRWNNVIVGLFFILGFAGAGGIAFLLTWPYVQKDYCLIFEDDFKTLDSDVWTHEVQIDGFGNGAFDWTTTDKRNSYVDAEGLHIVPTLTNETTSITNDQLYANYTLNLWKEKDGGDGSCTGEKNTSCVIRSNPVKGHMIPPIRSARLSTKGKKSIRYGQVEVVAKLPKGDWLWPAIWMLPEDSVYGVWPRSGEIDIMESRGNDRHYPKGGRNYYWGTNHWGPTTATDAYWRTTGAKKIRRGDYSEKFHTYGMQWTDKYIYFYIDSKVHQILFIGYKKSKPLYDFGKFSEMSENQTLLANPWATSDSKTGNAPFDQPFYLILNVAVGGTNGWFLDEVGDKPWINDATNAQWTFWSAADKWLPTWGEGDTHGMTVKSVRMWQEGKCGSSQEL